MTLPNCDIDSLLKLTIDNQRLNATLRIEPNQSSESITRDAVCAYLEGRGLHPQRILHDKIDELLEAINQDPEQPKEMVVVKGKPPMTGRNASFEFSERLKQRLEEISKREEAFKLATKENTLETQDIDCELAIDFYEESPFLIVSSGELIGQIISSSPGEDGIGVDGQAIPTKQGKDLTDLIDNSFRRDDDGHVYSLIDGCLTYLGMKLRVNPRLEIAGSVDFSTGNIDFPSDVLIHDGVKDRFSVKAGESIVIQKLVEASTLESTKDITLHNGMAGRDAGAIHSGGNLIAGYLDGVNASVSGDCKIAKEITNCTLKVAGKLDCPSAALRGGEATAANGGVIKSIGSVQGVKTDVIVGGIPEIEEKIRFAVQLKEQVLDSIEKQSKEIETFKTSIGKPNAEQATEIWYLESEIESFNEKLISLDTAIERLGQLIREHTEQTLMVISVIFAKTTIWLPGFCATFENDIKGELEIRLDKSGKPVVIRNGNSAHLNTIARVIADDRVMPLAAAKGDDAFSDESSDEFLEAA